jgi:CDP-diacylglycerol--glycerol-3-phosphate 3-phosphatidyltransferase
MAVPFQERFWTIPNILSLYRICIFPFILYLVIIKDANLFAVFITISMVTDILDGLIARVFKMQTKIGIKLDSWADIGTYFLAFLGIYVFKWYELKPYSVFIILFVAAYLLPYLIMLVKFKEVIGLHTYLFKITAYVQGGFIVLLFVSKLYLPLFYFAVFIGLLACIEEMIIVLIISKPVSNARGLYWILKNKA